MTNKVEIEFTADASQAENEIGALTGKLQSSAKEASMSWTDFRSMYSTVIDGFRVAQQVYDKTVGAAQAYDQEVYNLMVRTGGTAEETSRLVTVMEDMGIEYGTVQTAMKFAVKNGINPNIESIAKLSDEYLALNDDVLKGQFLLDKFGRSGMDMARAMEMGGQAILEMNSKVEKNLVLTDSVVQESEKYRVALNDQKDAWEGLTTVIGNTFMPAFTEATQIMTSDIEAVINLGDVLKGLNGIVDTVPPGVDRAAAAMKLLGDYAADIINTYGPEFMRVTKAETITIQEHTGVLKDDTYALEGNKQAMVDQYNAAYVMTDSFLTMVSDIANGSPEMSQNIQNLTNQWQAGKLTTQQYIMKVHELEAQIKAMDGLQSTAFINLVIKGGVKGAQAKAIMNAEFNQQNQNAGGAIGDGYADGGISTGPASGHYELLHGTEAVIPLRNGSIPISGGGGIVVNLTYAPMFSTADAQELQNKLTPFIEKGIRNYRNALA